MAKAKTKFVCSTCGREEPKFTGRCSTCHEWNTFVEQAPKTEMKAKVFSAKQVANRSTPGKVERMTQVRTSDYPRTSTGYAEFDRVLGGGIVQGSLVIISGDPGIGKSTLLGQVVAHLANQNVVLYASGEESTYQVTSRIERIGKRTDNLLLMNESNVASIIASAEEHNPSLLVVDSIQTMVHPDESGSPGNPSQVKAATSLLLDYAKNSNVPVFIVGHVTKDGDMSGPRTLEHMVDTVLYFEGDRQQELRILRTAKNRFGPTHEVGIFEMTERGLEEKSNPSELFTDDLQESGSVNVVMMEGTRPIVATVQALVAPTGYNFPKRAALGLDANKLTLLCATLERKCAIPLNKFDVYIKSVGGIKIQEPAVDLAIALAIVSAMKDKPLPSSTVVIGEVGLVGEIRKVPQFERRVTEAIRLGYTTIYSAPQRVENKDLNDHIHSAKRVREIIEQAFT